MLSTDWSTSSSIEIHHWNLLFFNDSSLWSWSTGTHRTTSDASTETIWTIHSTHWSTTNGWGQEIREFLCDGFATTDGTSVFVGLETVTTQLSADGWAGGGECERCEWDDETHQEEKGWVFHFFCNDVFVMIIILLVVTQRFQWDQWRRAFQIVCCLVGIVEVYFTNVKDYNFSVWSFKYSSMMYLSTSLENAKWKTILFPSLVKAWNTISYPRITSPSTIRKTPKWTLFLSSSATDFSIEISMVFSKQFQSSF